MSTAKVVTILHPSSAVNNIVNDASGNVALGNNLTVAGTATLTGNVTASGTLTVGGVSAVAVAPGTTGNVLTSNGTAWTSAAPSSGGTPSAIGQIPFSTNGTTYTATQKITQATTQASTSGTSIDFTSIPSWVKRVTVMFSGVSTSGTSNKIVQIGSGSITTSGYLGSCGYHITGAGVTSITTGFGIATVAATDTFYGSMVIETLGSNVWQASVGGGLGNTNCTFTGGGGVTISGALDRVRITTINGTDTFDAGSINILYE